MGLVCRILLVALLLSPLLTALVSLLIPPLIYPWTAKLAFMPLALAAPIGAVNFWLTTGGYLLHRARGRSKDSYRSGSVVPFVGTVLGLLAVLLAAGNPLVAVLALALMVFDTGGTPWALIALWHDPSFWDEGAGRGSP